MSWKNRQLSQHGETRLEDFIFLFLFPQVHLFQRWPAVRTSWSHNHTYSLLFLYSGNCLCWVYSRFNCLVWSRTQPQSNDQSWRPAACSLCTDLAAFLVQDEVVGTSVTLMVWGFILSLSTWSCMFSCSSLTFLFIELLFAFRVIYLQVSMNNGLSFISSNVHITTTECVSVNVLTSLHVFDLQSFLIECTVPQSLLRELSVAQKLQNDKAIRSFLRRVDL